MAQAFELAKTPRGRWAVYCKGSQTYEFEGKGKRFCQQMVDKLNGTDEHKPSRVLKLLPNSEIKADAIQECLSAIFKESIFDDDLLDYTWTSGSSTEVFPIGFWANEVQIQLKGGREMQTAYEVAAKRVAESNPTIFTAGYVNSYDGSCPMSVTFKYTDETKQKFEK